VIESIFVGLQTSKDELYVLEKVSDDKFILKVPISGKEYELERELFKPFLMGKDVQRYCDLSSNKFVFFPYKLENGIAIVITEKEIKEKFPKTYNYFTDHEKEFKARESGKAGKMEHWYSYIYPKNLNKFEQPKLSSMEICANHPNVTFDDQNFYHTTKVYSWVMKKQSNERYEYLLAIANSTLLWWFLKITGDTLQGDARTFKTNYLNPFPIPLNINELNEMKIVEKVNSILEKNKVNPNSNTCILGKEIDQLVFEVYGLTEEEIKIVEKMVTG
jgi:adenine-specific DNA-methyltransferase